MDEFEQMLEQHERMPMSKRVELTIGVFQKREINSYEKDLIRTIIKG